MDLSIIGALVCGFVGVLSRFSPQPAVTALIASLAFGATAVVILPALGGSSPIISVVFLCALLAIAALQRNAIDDLCHVFVRQPIAWLIMVLILYAVVGAVLLPRIFSGETTAFVPVRDEGRVAEVALVPVTGNITQSLYFVLGALSFFGLSMLLLKPGTFAAIRIGFFMWANLHVSMGFIDLLGKLGGLGDVLEPIRTASYAMLTNVDVAGFARIAGAYSEASTFGGMSALLLAFTFTYWRATSDMLAAGFSLALLCLVVLSTSTTAYVVLGILGLVLLLSLAASTWRGRLQEQDLILIAGALVGLTILVGIVLYNNSLLDPFWQMFDEMVLNKATSASAHERSHWNWRSLQSVLDTAGLGIGIGSSRASSWIIAVASQLGVVGTIIMVVLVFEVVRGGSLRYAVELDPTTRVTVLSMRAASLTALLTASISGGSADPGLVFFMTLAAVTSLRATACTERHAISQSEGLSYAAPSLTHGRT